MNTTAKHMRIASLIQIILGIISIVTAQIVMKNGDTSAAGLAADDMMLELILAYGGAGLQILAGLVGLLRAGKKSLITVILGILLYIPQLWRFFQTDGNTGKIVLQIAMLVITYYYLHMAHKAFKGR